MAREAAMRDDIVPFRGDDVILVSKCAGQCSDEIEQAFTAWGDMGAVLDILVGPETLGGHIIPLVEQRVESLQHDRFVLFRRGFGHAVSRMEVSWRGFSRMKSTF